MISAKKLNSMLQEEIAKAKACGFKLYSVLPIEEFPKAVSFFAECCYENATTRKIRVSFFYLNAPEEDIRETLMHEVLHCVVGNHGHGKEWQRCVEIVNEKYGYGIEVHPYRFDRVCYDIRKAAEEWREENKCNRRRKKKR